MKNNKRKSTVLIKLLGPVIALGLLTMITAVVGLQSMIAVQKASKTVSGNGFRALICFDEINKDFIQTQKYCLAVCGEPDNEGLYEYVVGQLKEFQSDVASYEEELLAMDDYFSDSDITTMNAVFSAMDNAQQETVELMTKAMSGDKDIISEANQVMQEWSTNIGDNLDTLITSNDEVIKANVEKQEKIYNANRATAFVLMGISVVLFIITVVVAVETIVKPLRRQNKQLSDIIDNINNGKGFAVVADEIRQLADSSRETANNIQTINEQVIEAVNGLVKASERIISYINENILPDYEAFVQGGRQYSEDAVHIDDSMAEYEKSAEEILSTMIEITDAIEGINKAVEESANGVTDAAVNVDSLVQSMSEVHGKMEENSSVAKNLKDESANFVNV